MLIEVSDYTWGAMLIIIFNMIVIQFPCLLYIYWLLYIFNTIVIQFACLSYIYWLLYDDYLNSIGKHWYKCRSNIMDVAENLSMAKKNEIQHLKHMVQLVGTLSECILVKLCCKWTRKQVLFDSLIKGLCISLNLFDATIFISSHHFFLIDNLYFSFSNMTYKWKVMSWTWKFLQSKFGQATNDITFSKQTN